MVKVVLTDDEIFKIKDLPSLFLEQDEPDVCLGKADIISHQSKNPMKVV